MSTAQTHSRWLRRGALLAFLVGTGAGLGTLIAPAGVWFGLWPFGTGFVVLGAVNPWTPRIALLCLVAAVILYALARKARLSNANSLAGLALAGALASGIAWYIPATFQAPEGQSYPPIHDVSTDLVDIPQFIAVLPLRADAPNTTVYGEARNMTPERNAQLQRDAYPDLVPRYYEASEEEMFERALAAVDAMGWELVAADPDGGHIEATATTFWFRFKDDIVIRIRPLGAQTVVDARSLSRVGGGDLGANAKRLRKFFELL